MKAQKVILKKSWVNYFGKKYGVGTILQVDKNLHDQLITGGFGDDYQGEYPPLTKPKINLNTK